MAGLVKQIKNWIGTKGWSYPPLVGMRDERRLGVATSDPEKYFQERKQERGWLVECFKRHFEILRFSVCSVGTGYGGEEYTLKPCTSRMVLIEPDERQNRFLRSRFPPDTEVIKSFFQFCQFAEPFDLIYASALSYWMDRDPLEGVNGDMLTFLKKNLKPSGLGVFLIYGGNHSALILNQLGYICKVVQTTHEAGLKVLLYGKYQPRGALLILSATPQDVTVFSKSVSQPWVLDDKILGGDRPDISTYLATGIIASYTALKNLRKTAADFTASIRLMGQLRSHDRST